MVLGKLDSHMYISKVGTHSHTIHKINSKCLKVFNIRHDTMKLLEKNKGKEFSDINIPMFPKDSPSKQ